MPLLGPTGGGFVAGAEVASAASPTALTINLELVRGSKEMDLLELEVVTL